MAVIETWIKTDLKRVVRVNPIGGNLFSQDNMGNLIGVELLENGQPATVSGSVSANVLRADGATVAVSGTLSGNRASVTLPQAAYAVPGMLAVVIKLTTGSVVTTIGAIQAIVYRSSSDTIVDPGTIIPSVQDLIAAIDAAVDSIPPDYSDLVGEVDDLKSAIDVLDGRFQNGINFFNPNDPEIELNVELKSTGATAEKTGYFVSPFYPIKPGESFCANFPVNTYGGGSIVVVYNANKERLSYHLFTAEERLTDARGYGYVTWTVPSTGWENVAYFRLTGVMSSMPLYMYVYADEMPAAYVPYTDKVTLSDDVIVPFESIEDIAVSKEYTDFIKPEPVNLVDFSAMVPGIIKNSGSNGGINENASWLTTDFIPVEPGATYALCIMPGVYYGANFVGIPVYDADKNQIARVTQSGGSVGAIAARVTITIPDRPDAKYIRTSYYENYINPAYDQQHMAAAKRWWMCQIFKADSWPGDMYVSYDGVDKIVQTGLENAESVKYNALFGKTALWNGDSICAADGDPFGGWPGRVAKANGMSFTNYGVSGGTVAENTTADHSVSATLDGMITDFPDADYVIIEGGTNDADILGDSGIGAFDADDFSTEYIAALNKNTFSGALESVFYRLVTQMKGKHIGYLIPQKMGHTEVLVSRRRVYFDRAVAIAQKWGIPVLDLWNGLYFNWRLAAHWDQTMTTTENETAGNLYRDGQHLTSTGYAIESPIIAEWMRTF